MRRPSIAIIGAGVSSTLLALPPLRRCPDLTRMALIERNTWFGHGQCQLSAECAGRA